MLPPPRPTRESREGQRIAKLLARAGIASRREIERMIAEGRIAIGGVKVETPATVLSSLHGVTVDGKPVQAPAPARLFRYHKPAGLLTTERDPQGRPTIYDRLPAGLPRVMPVGRLDLNTEGLLLLTTDGELKRALELPATGVERTYRARVFGAVSQDQLEGLIHGVEIEGIRYGAIDANLERRTGRNAWIELRLAEGKNREVRRVLEHLDLKVSRLIRTAYGPFPLADLPAGAVDEVRQHDLVAFRKALSSGTSFSLSERRPAGARPGDAPAPRATGSGKPSPSRRGAAEARPGDAPAPRAPGRGRTGKFAPPGRRGTEAPAGDAPAQRGPGRGRTGKFAPPGRRGAEAPAGDAPARRGPGKGRTGKFAPPGRRGGAEAPAGDAPAPRGTGRGRAGTAPPARGTRKPAPPRTPPGKGRR